MDINKNSLANLKPFKKMSECTPEEKERMLEISSKGGQALKNKYDNARTLKEVCNNALRIKVSREKAQTYLGDDVDLLEFDNDGMVEMQDVMTIRAMRLGTDGNIRAYDYIRDTSGQKPKDDISITGDLISDADRQLLQNISARLYATDGKTPETPENENG